MRATSNERLVVALTAIAGFAATVLVFFPGFLDADTVAMLEYARRREIPTDVHSPFVVALWMSLDAMSLGRGAMLLVIAAAYWGGLALASRSMPGPPRARAVAILVVGALPPLFSWLAVLDKDTTLMALISLAIGALAHAGETPRARASALVILAVATLVRHNAFLFTVPMATLAARDAIPPLRTPARTLFLGVGLTAVALGSSRVVDGALLARFHGTPAYPTQQILTHDLVGMSLEHGRLLHHGFRIVDARRPDGSEPAPRPATLADLGALYSPRGVVPLYWGRGARLEWETSFEAVRVRRADWIAAIARHPFTYAHVRLRITRYLFGLAPTSCSATRLDMAENRLGLEAPSNPALRAWAAIDRVVRRGPLHRGIVWLVVCAWLALVARRRAIPPEIAFAATSAVVYGLAFLVISPACSFRLTLPLAFVGALGLGHVAMRRRYGLVADHES